MKPRSALALLVLALAAWGAWFAFLREVPGTDERRARAGRLLPDLERQEVTRVEIDRPAGALRIVRAKGAWRMEQPVADAADAFAVDGLLDALAGARAEARVGATDVRGGDAATGLGAGALEVRLTGAGGTTTALAVGAAEGPGGRRYARLADGGLALVEESLLQELQKPADEFREHAVVALAPSDVRRARVERAGRPALAFEQRGADQWWIVAPLVDDADDAAVSGIVSRVATLRADRFADPAAPLPATEYTVHLWGAASKGSADDPPLATVRIGAADGGASERIVTATGRDARFVVLPGSVVAELTKEPAGFRSRVALEASTFDVASFTLGRGGAARRFVKGAEPEGGGDAPWTVDGEPAAKPDPAAVRERLSRLARIDATRIADGVTPAQAGLDAPVARLTVAGADPTRLPQTTLEVGGPAGPGEVYARRSGRPAILVIDAAVAALIDPATLNDPR